MKIELTTFGWQNDDCNSVNKNGLCGLGIAVLYFPDTLAVDKYGVIEAKHVTYDQDSTHCRIAVFTDNFSSFTKASAVETSVNSLAIQKRSRNRTSF